ncbi:MAG: hypothetical protein K9N06_11885 [Candidatus Cloacimonetes bacterium]|nr:hypothetical protein [Candidatus Cloacimonadota bacterium]
MKFYYILIIIALFLLLTGCKIEKYGSDITVNKVTPISQALAEKDSLDTITLKGEIGAVCPTGCWFYLQDQSGEIYVDLAPSGLAIPQRSGKKAVVEGSFIKVKDRSVFVAKGVEIQ